MLKNLINRFFGNNADDITYRFIAGFSLAIIGTLFVVVMFKEALSWYKPSVMAAAFLMCVGYSGYLYSCEPGRLRLFLAKYFQALLIVIVATQIPDSFIAEMDGMTSIPVARIIALIPVIAAFGAILYTFIAGSDPDVVVHEKKKDR